MTMQTFVQIAKEIVTRGSEFLWVLLAFVLFFANITFNEQGIGGFKYIIGGSMLVLYLIYKIGDEHG
jgi:hypothetical protein